MIQSLRNRDWNHQTTQRYFNESNLVIEIEGGEVWIVCACYSVFVICFHSLNSPHCLLCLCNIYQTHCNIRLTELLTKVVGLC